MPDFTAPVAVPNFLAAVPPKADTSWLGQLPQDYRQGILQQRQVDIANAGQDSTPPGASAPDFAALTNRLMQLGAYDQAGQLMALGIRQKVLNSPSSLDDPLGRGSGSGPQASAASPGFGPAVKQTLAFEGGLNPRDTNGTPSNFGINAAANPDVDVKNLTPDQAQGIYKTRYWDAIGADSLPPALQGMAFDTAVIAGPGRAKQLLAQSGGDPAKFMDLREAFQNNLLNADPQKYGAYADAWAQRNATLRAGIGGQPSTVAAYAPQPAAAPAQAAIGSATGQQPYRVASLGPVAPPAVPGSGATPTGAPTGSSPASTIVTPQEWAAKFNPNDPALAGKIADALGIDATEGVDVRDTTVRGAVLPVLQASRRGAASPPLQSGAPSPSTDQPAGNVHPFGPGATNAESGNTVAPLHAPSPVAGSISPAATEPASTPVAPIAARPVASPTPANGPDIPGLPAAYQQPGGGQRYVNDILNMASQFEDAGLTGRAKVYLSRAQQVQSQLEAAQKAQLDLQTHNAELTPEQKNFGVMRDQYGFTGSPLDLQGQEAQQKAIANAQARNLILTPGEKEFQQSGFQGTQAGYEADKGAQIEEAKGQAAYLGGMPKQLAIAADAARQTSNSIDQMLTAAQGFRMGSGAQMDQGTRKVLQGVFTRLGVDDPSLNDATASYEDFGKLAGVLNRQAAQQVGGRTGVQEMQLIGSTLPSPEMTYDGFRGVASSLKGSADYTIARQQASQDWLADPSHNNSLRGFDAAFNRNVSPSAFWLARLQTDQPDLFSQTVQKLGQTAQGRALLTKAKAGMTWANGNGLLDQ